MKNSAIRHMVAAFCGLVALLWSGGPGATPVFAHAVVIEASPQDGAILQEAPTEIMLRFNALIEPSLSRVTLATEEGQTIPLPEGQQNREPSNMLVVPLPPLGPGRYQLRFKVLATDGHATPGALNFTISADFESP